MSHLQRRRSAAASVVYFMFRVWPGASLAAQKKVFYYIFLGVSVVSVRGATHYLCVKGGGEGKECRGERGTAGEGFATFQDFKTTQISRDASNIQQISYKFNQCGPLFNPVPLLQATQTGKRKEGGGLFLLLIRRNLSRAAIINRRRRHRCLSSWARV